MRLVKMLFILNPQAGTENKTDPATIISSKMKENRISYRIVEINNDLNQKKIKTITKNSKAEIVIAAGGDGTVNMVAASIIGLPVRLGILPLGSANGLAFELGIPLTIEAALETIIAGKTKPIDGVLINGTYTSLHLSDVGMNARVIKGFEKEGKRGFIRYFKHLIKELKKPKVFKCEIETDGRTYTYRSMMTVIANSGSYRSGAVINPSGKKDDGYFEVIVLKPRKYWIWHNTIAAFTGSFHTQSNIETYRCTSAKIKVSPAQDLQVDGELIGKTQELKAEILKHAFQIIVP